MDVTDRYEAIERAIEIAERANAGVRDLVIIRSTLTRAPLL